ncbi:hypothetical protein ABZY03_31550 [Streptomyces klenkii]
MGILLALSSVVVATPAQASIGGGLCKTGQDALASLALNVDATCPE